MKLNIEGGEFPLLEAMLSSGLISLVRHLQVQFHRFVPDADRRRDAIRTALARTHAQNWCYPYVWESWSRR